MEEIQMSALEHNRDKEYATAFCKLITLIRGSKAGKQMATEEINVATCMEGTRPLTGVTILSNTGDS